MIIHFKIHFKIIHFISLTFYKDAYLVDLYNSCFDRYEKFFPRYCFTVLPLLYIAVKPSCFYKTQRFSCSICFSFLRKCLPFLAHLCNVTFDIPQAYLEPSQLPKMKLLATIVKGFQAITIFAKISILDV